MQLDYSYLYNGAVKKLHAFLKKLSKSAAGVEIELSVQQGLPSARIDEIALDKKADLIIMGTTGRGRVERMMFGSNALRVIRKAPCMVLLIPPKAKFNGFKKIAYATDLTADNLAHARQLLPFATLFDSEIIFLNVGEDADYNESDLKKIRNNINKTIRYKNKSGYVTADFDLVRGVNFSAKNHKVDCIAVYTRQKTLFGRLFGTSMAADLSLHATLPLLVIHEEDAVLPAFVKSEKKKSAVMV
jgi:nucleotide-binding universal stress UspA family protein